MPPLAQTTAALSTSGEIDPATPQETCPEGDKTPLHLTPLEKVEYRARRETTSSVSAVRTELRGDIGRLDGKVDKLAGEVSELGKTVSAASGQLETLTGILRAELEARRETTRNTVNVTLEERKATGAFRRELWTKVVLAVLGFLAAIQAAYLVTK